MRLRCVRPHNSERSKCASHRFEKIYAARLVFPVLVLISGVVAVRRIPPRYLAILAPKMHVTGAVCLKYDHNRGKGQDHKTDVQGRHHKVSRLLSTIRYTTTVLPEGGDDG